MSTMEQAELDRYRADIVTDVKSLVEKYREIFDWDIPEIDQRQADHLILAEIRTALASVESELPS